MRKRWQIVPIIFEQIRLWSEKLHIGPEIAEILLRRNWSMKDAAAFLCVAKKDFYDPFLLPNMRVATARINAAIYKREIITIFGDYDVDGITSTAVLYKTLKKLGARVEYYLPDRQKEGYGLHKEAIEKFKFHTKLLITVDCGIRSVDEVEYANDFMDVIITDHHLPGKMLPAALAVIDPKRDDCTYPDKNLAGVGVAFKLCQALWQSSKGEKFTHYLDIVALGTVADIVPLLDENRKIVQMGLKKIENKGLLALIDICRLNAQKLNSADIGFVIGPRFNAAGRLAQAGWGVELLLTDDEEKVYEIAKLLDEENKKRKQLVETAFAEAKAQVIENAYEKTAAIIVSARGWHPGIIGIVASRLVDVFYRPTIVISIDESGKGKGSCRSIDGLNINDALAASADTLLGFGGHAMAAGLTIQEKDITKFRQILTQYVMENLDENDFFPQITIDDILKPQQVTKNLLEELEVLEPFGAGNPPPLFLCTDVEVIATKKMGVADKHLRCRFSSEQQSYTAIGWNMGEQAEELNGKKIDMIFSPGINVWQEKEYMQFMLKDIRPTSFLYPSHDKIGKFYLLLKKLAHKKKNINLAVVKAGCNQYVKDVKKIDYCIKVLTEIKIIELTTDGNIKFLPLGKGKKSLNASATFLKRYMQ